MGAFSLKGPPQGFEFLNHIKSKFIEDNSIIR
ncbi:MAG: hypothetical protein ACI884_001856 [Ulvibacter sp.]|jgi:hypothetical protein